MCQHLEAVTEGRIKRLLINVPPGFMKSLLVCVFWPSWEWSAKKKPHLRYIAFSYSATLTERDNEKFLYLMQSREFQDLYGRIFKITKEGVGRVANSGRGYKYASSIGGTGTGERADRVILDDPHNVKEAESDIVRQDAVRWFNEAMQNRLNNAMESVIIVICQRVHEADVSGEIINEYPNYEHLCVPMDYDGRDWRADGKYKTSIGWFDPRTVDGDLAWEARYPDAYLAQFRKNPYLFSGQYQQAPSPRGGGIIKRDYWKIWDAESQAANDVKTGLFPIFEFVLASFDGAFTEKEERDYSALVIIGAWIETSDESRFSEQFGTPRLMMMHAWHKRLTLHGKTDFVQLPGETKAEFDERRRQGWGIVEHIAADCKKFKVDKLIIENKASGHTVEQEMRRLFSRENWTVALHDPGRMDKVARAYSVEHLFADGLVWRPETAWGQLIEDELANLPRGAHDDVADAAINGIIHLRRMRMAQRKDESHAAIEEMIFPSRTPGRRLYET